MSEKYISLYRKYRPQKLEEIVGQEHIKKALSNAIQLGKIAHAYLFTGPRGTGKTSTARILAKSLNCEKAPTTEPCGKCESCKDIINSVPIDVVEIDAASNRGIQDVKDILEKIQYAPVHRKNNIYIIDEVHMFSKDASNALLKTLEEPPENVIFILATTETHKVLDTIKSRCQRFDFRRITVEDIAKHLRNVANKEKINISDGAIMMIAKSSAGGMRDSLALLDQVSILGETKEIDEEDINSLLGRLSFEILHDISDKILQSDSVNAIKIIEKVYNSGNDPVQILNNLMMYFKNLLIVKNCTAETSIELTNLNKQQIDILNEQKENVETHQIIFLIDKTAEYIKQIKNSVNQQMWLEVGIIDLANLADNTKLLDLQNRIQALEGGAISERPHQRVVSKPVQTIATPKAKTEQKAEETQQKTESIPEVAEAKQEKPAEEDFTPMPNVKIADKSQDISTLWATLLSNIKSAPTQAILKLAKPVKIAPDGIIITFKQEMFVKRIDSNKKTSIIEAADIMFGQKDTPVTVRTPIDSDAEIEVAKPVVKKTEHVTPAKTLVEEKSETSDELETISEHQEEKKTEKQETKRIESDQSKMIKDLFDGKYL